MIKSTKQIYYLVSFIILTITTSNSMAVSTARITALRCEYQVNPLGIDVKEPRLSWILESDKRGECQTAYQILVSSSPAMLSKNQGDIWNSGKVNSDQSVHVVYSGKPLVSCKQYWWKVRVWDQSKKTSDWSEPATWAMGLLKQDDWQAKWIGLPLNEHAPDPEYRYVLPVFRREFTIKEKIKKAIVSVCGLGYYELYLNGEKVGSNVFDPGWTEYDKRCLYTTYDVSSDIREGVNAFGAILGNGFYNDDGRRQSKDIRTYGPPKLILQLYLQYTDGSSELVVTDENWKADRSPVTYSNTYGGEDYDARMEQKGWTSPGFNGSKWVRAAIVDGPGGKLVLQSAPPIKVMQTFNTVRITEPSSGIYIYDFGQNCSGRPRIKIRGKAGDQIKLIPEEVLSEDGTLKQREHFGPCYFTYTLKGEGEEIWAPRFSSYGFRYIQVEGASRESGQCKPQIVSVESEYVGGSAETIGQFSCSNDLFNKIHKIIDWAIKSNMWSVLTDCPHRERLGWLEEDHLMGPSIMYNYNVPNLLEKICQDMCESQTKEGLIPDVSPTYAIHEGGFRDAPAWGSSCVIVPWFMYQWYGDKSVLEKHYGMMKRYVDYLTSKSKDGIVSHGLGDWCDLSGNGAGFSEQTPLPAVESSIYTYDVMIMEQTSRLLGKEEDGEKYSKLADDVRKVYNREFFHQETSQYTTGTQASNAMPLGLGITEPGYRKAVLENIIKDIREHGNHLTVGEVSHRFLIKSLSEAGRSDVVFDMTNQTDNPSYGYQLAKGMTSLAESWDVKFGNSMNHFMLGHIEEWFYRDLAGIQCDPEGPGYKRIIIKPNVVGDLTWVKGNYNSLYGKIESNWELKDGKLILDVTIPVNTSAIIYVPSKSGPEISESGKPTDQAKGVKFLRKEGNAAVYAVGSGSYSFKSEIK